MSPKRSFHCHSVLLVAVLGALSLAQEPRLGSIRANDNRMPAGKLEGGVLTLHLEITSGEWHPEADGGQSMRVNAFAEEGQAPQIPGPLLRVPEGTMVVVSFHNQLTKAAVIHGMHSHPGDNNDTLEVQPGETRERHFVAGEPGTYQYFASAGGELNRGRPFREDSQLHGAFIVDPRGGAPPDRVFVLGVWRSEVAPTMSKDIAVINGKSWPFTEQLTYESGRVVRWRFVNASDVNHPMHMHGSYFRVDSLGDGERDRVFPAEEQRSVVTQLLLPGSTMTTTWSAVPGRWIFHCHLLPHVAASRTVATALSPEPESNHDHGSNHMAGLVLGIIVPGERPRIATTGSRTRKLRLLVKQRAAVNGVAQGFGYQIRESHRAYDNSANVAGPMILLERGQPVEITVENHLRESTAVHWHGMELESYYDGVAGWGMRGVEVTPTIMPGESFCAKFTPPRAGTFIYHTHLDDEIQLTSGLYGPLIVEEPGEKFDAKFDKIFLVSGWGGRRSANPDKPIAALLNGSGEPAELHWKKGQSYRVRIINISSNLLGMVSLSNRGEIVKWRARAKDGADLSENQQAMQDAKLLIGPGETYDFEFHPTASADLVFQFQGTAIPVTVSEKIEVE